MAWVKPRPGATVAAEELTRFCQGRHRHVQGPALLEVRRGVSDDGDRQGAEVPHA